MTHNSDRDSDRLVLLLISGGLIAILLSIILGLFLTPRALPNWAENVLVSIASVAGLKLGDCLSTLVQMSTGRQVERLGSQLAAAAPAGPVEATIVNQPDNPVHVEETNP